MHRRDYVTAYVDDLPAVIDLAAIRDGGLRLGVDPLGGASVAHWVALAERHGLDLTTVDDTVDPTFRFMPPDWDGKIRMDWVLAAAAPDTEALAGEIEAKVERVQVERGNIVWLEGMLQKPEVIQLLSHATLFLCPSIYEPLGIVNREAMACGAAVVATRTGGIPEVVVDGETGLLVPFDDFDPETREPRDPQRFASDIAEKVNLLLGDPALAERFGKAGRERVVEKFSWSAIAEETLALYRSLAA